VVPNTQLNILHPTPAFIFQTYFHPPLILSDIIYSIFNYPHRTQNADN